MTFKIGKVDVWAGEIADRPGALNEKLEAVAKAGANLEFVIARRMADKPGFGMVYVAPLKGARQAKAAMEAGLAKATSMNSLRFEGPDKPGLGAKMTKAITDAGINMRGLSSAAIGRRCVVYLAFDSDADSKKAAQILKKAMSGK